ncbi:MAG: HAMP domain-containing sensor histidine kinase [Aeromonadaceae bacterium]
MNLFWKIFLGFWLSLLLMALGAVAMVRLYDEARLRNPDQVADDKRTGFIVDTTARALQEGGLPALTQMGRLLPPPAEPPQPLSASPQPPAAMEPAAAGPTLPERARQKLPLVVDAQGRELFGRSVPQQAWHQALAMAHQLPRAPNFHSPVRQVQLPDGQEVTVFMLNRMLPVERNLLFSVAESPMLLPLSALLASLLFSLLLTRYLVRPIRILRDGMRQIAAGQFEVAMSRQMGHRRDELGELGQDADRMAWQLKQLISTQRRLLHDISHDLRSPLARLQVAIGLVRQDPERLPEMLQRLEHETMRLNEMIGEVLTLARLESGVPQPQEDYLDLVSLLQSLVEDVRFEDQDHPLILQIASEQECLLPCHGELLWRAFDNLVRNALQHTPSGAEIRIRLEEFSDEYLITIEDTGPGIPPELLAEVFEPFHHAGDTRGHGLGLAIAKRAIEAHQGTIHAENVVEGGLRLLVRLPRPAATQSLEPGSPRNTRD